MVPIWYASLGEVKRAADIPSSAFYDARLIEAMDEGKDAVASLCQRSVEPTIQTVTFAWPQDMTQDARMLHLGRHQLISITAVIDGDGSTLDNADLRLIKEGSADDGPPYSAIMNANGWTSNSLFPNVSIRVLGLYGDKLDERLVTTTASDLSSTVVDVTDSSRIDVGSVIRIATERLVVTSKGWLNSGSTAPVTLDAEEHSDRFTVTSGGAFHIGEAITIESEEMLITKIIGNQLIVTRATNGSGIAAHTAVTAVFVDRRLAVERAVLGTAAVDTPAGADVLLHQFPALLRQLHKAEVLNIIQQDAAAYGSRSGSGQGEIPLAERALERLRERVKQAYGYRPVRSGAV